MTNNKRIKLLLSMVLMFTMMFSGNIVAKAETIKRPVINSINISEKTAGYASEIEISMSATLEGKELAEKASMAYLLNGQQKGLKLTLVDGKYEGKVLIDDTFEPGLLKISFVVLEDKEGNAYSVCNSDVYAGIGQDLSEGNFTFVQEDTQAPVLKSISVDKENIDKNQSVNITIEALDNYAGLAEEAMVCYSTTTGSAMVLTEKEVTLELVDGKYTGKFRTDEQTEAGLYEVSYITLKDTFGNEIKVYNSEVHEGKGLDLSFANFTVTENIAPKGFSLEVKESLKKGNSQDLTIIATNNELEDLEVILVLGIFDENNKLINYVALNEVVEGEGNTEVSSTLKILPDSSVIKCMVVDSLDNMKVLSKIIEIDVKE